MELSTFSYIQLFIWMFLFFTIIVTIMYLYCQKNYYIEKDDGITASISDDSICKDHLNNSNNYK